MGSEGLPARAAKPRARGFVQRVLATCFALGTAASVSPADWPPISPAEQALRTPLIDPEADAEAILWDVRVAHEAQYGTVRTELRHYIRLKVFTESGRERLGTVDIPYTAGEEISEVAGRTIKPDGTSVELAKDSVYDRTLFKTGDLKVQAKSFALPGLEVGSIVEYRWKETLADRLTNYFRLSFQRDLPIHNVRYHIKPLRDPAFPYGMRTAYMHLKLEPLTKEKDGFFGTSVTNVAAFKAEPDMPSEVAVRPWMLVFYAPDSSDPPARYWQRFGKQVYDGYKEATKVTDEMRTAAAAAVAGATDDEGRVGKLFAYVANEIEYVRRPPGEGNRNAQDIWKEKAGTGYDATILFIALAGSLGYEARLVRSSERDFGTFDPSFTDPYFLRGYNVAVRVGGAWRFCDPASARLPFGMLRRAEEGQRALISDPDHAELVVTPTAPPEASLTRREGSLKLDADGTIEGEVRLLLTGHSAYDLRLRYDGQSAADREEAVRTSVKARFAAAEVSQVKMKGVSGPEPLEIAYRIRIPAFVQRTGRRLFLPCAFFQSNQPPRYTATTRRYPLAYPYAWSEKDTMVYELPSGYAMQEARLPAGLQVPEVGEYNFKLRYSAREHRLIYERTFDFGRAGHILFPATGYPAVKHIFDQVQELDNYTVELRQAAN
jgi:hypothetical protein